MTVSLKHAFASPKADGADATKVRPSNWNAEHVLNMSGSYILGRQTAGEGPVEEITAIRLLNGNVGIGTASPGARLDVAGYTKLGNYGGTFQGLTIANNAASSAAFGAAFIDFHNELGTSIANVFAGIETDGSSFVEIATTPAGSRSSDRRVARVRVMGEGAMLIGTTSNFVWNGANGSGAGIFPDGFGAFVRTNNPAMNVRRLNSDGTAIIFGRNTTDVGNISVTATATAYNTSSDYRLKGNVQPMTGALAKVATLNPVTFTWNANGSAGQGFIAHELAAVIPDAVTGEKDAQDESGNPVYQGVDHSRIVATLTAAIQEQQAMIAALTARVTALEATP
jgi:hypothetical protein